MCLIFDLYCAVFYTIPSVIVFVVQTRYNFYVSCLDLLVCVRERQVYIAGITEIRLRHTAAHGSNELSTSTRSEQGSSVIASGQMLQRESVI